MYAFCQDMPGISVEDQAKITPLMAPDALNGCIAHVAGPIEGGCRIIDVWESEEQYRAFQQEAPLSRPRQTAARSAPARHPRASAVLGSRGHRRGSHRKGLRRLMAAIIAAAS